MTESTNTTIAQATPGSTAKRHGFWRAQRIARPDRELSTAPPAATAKNATEPADSAPVRARCPVIRCRTRSPAVTTAPAAPAAAHGASDIAAPETAISSRRVSPGESLRVGADIVTPWVADEHFTVKIYRFFAEGQSAAGIHPVWHRALGLQEDRGSGEPSPGPARCSRRFSQVPGVDQSLAGITRSGPRDNFPVGSADIFAAQLRRFGRLGTSVENPQGAFS